MKESGLGIGTIMFLIFMILKLCGIISWSWWWVTSPIWIPVVFIAFIAIISFIIVFIKKK